jgi:hypothetical protein
VRVTVIAAGFERLIERPARADSRISRLLEEPVPLSKTGEEEEEQSKLPSILVEEEDEIFKPAQETVVFDAEEDLDIPDFLKS